MKTSLHLEAPNDLSVGTVRIEGEGQEIADWVATPNNRTFEQDDVEPGLYSCVITPAGVPPQSVFFEVREGVANTVILPSFSALSSSGGNTSFFDVETRQATGEFIYPTIERSVAEFRLQGNTSFESFNSERYPNDGYRKINMSEERKRISIGLSEENRKCESFDLFKGQSTLELFAGRLEIELPTDLGRDLWAGYRVRMSVAIEKARVERCLLPMYRGGTKITVAAPSFSPADLEFVIMPADPKVRALVRALDAGSSAEVAAIRDDVIGNVDPATLLLQDADPWAAILVGLISIRFPEHFPQIGLAWADKLVEQVGWSFDAHVIRASYALTAAGTTASGNQNIESIQDAAIGEAIASLAKAQIAGSPYYNSTNNLFSELTIGISDYLKKKEESRDLEVVKRFDRILTRWHRELPLQRGAGATFTWLARDLDALKSLKILVPKRNSSGMLRHRDSLVIFEGQVSAGQIAIYGGRSNAYSGMHENYNSNALAKDGYLEMPALRRAPGPADDPNRGRFGGHASRSGYRLSATFEPTESRNWVTINLNLEADRSRTVQLGDFAWFVLHPTFSPSSMKVTFRGSRATLRLRAWGGFTVGVWMPKAGIELECNLAEIEGAPHIIRTL
jgi:hypothetical protein